MSSADRATHSRSARLQFSSDVSDDYWAMLDCLEAFVARKLDGVVYASEGIYDQELQPLWRFER